LAQRSDFDDWANILFIVIVAILWLLGGLIKAIGGKKPPQTQAEPGAASKDRRRPGETWQERLVRRAEELQRRLEEAAGLEKPEKRRPPAREPASRPSRPPGGKITVRPGPRGESILVYEQPQPPATMPREPQVVRPREAQEAVTAARRYATVPRAELTRREGSEPPIQGLPSIMAESTESLDPDAVQLETQRESAGFEPAALIDYSDPDALKKAILHYEILGKPLALRDTSEGTQTF
jgi:hypothetical protein